MKDKSLIEWLLRLKCTIWSTTTNLRGQPYSYEEKHLLDIFLDKNDSVWIMVPRPREYLGKDSQVHRNVDSQRQRHTHWYTKTLTLTHTPPQVNTHTPIQTIRRHGVLFRAFLVTHSLRQHCYPARHTVVHTQTLV